MYRTTERFLEIKTHPATSEVMRLADDVSVKHRARVPNRDGVVLPTDDTLPNGRDHGFGCECRARREFHSSLLARGAHLYVRAANVNDQDCHRQ